MEMRLLSLLARDVLRAMFVSARVFRATTSSSKSTVSEGREFALSATSSCSSAARAAASEDTVPAGGAPSQTGRGVLEFKS